MAVIAAQFGRDGRWVTHATRSHPQPLPPGGEIAPTPHPSRREGSLHLHHERLQHPDDERGIDEGGEEVGDRQALDIEQA